MGGGEKMSRERNIGCGEGSSVSSFHLCASDSALQLEAHKCDVGC